MTYYPVPTFAEALADVIDDVRSAFPTWNADTSDPVYYVAEILAQRRIDDRNTINESRQALIWPIQPGIDGASQDDLIELARSVAIVNQLPEETDAALLERMNNQWLGLAETDARVRLLVLSRPNIIDMSQVNAAGYNKTVHVQTDLGRATTQEERDALQIFMRGPTGAPWYVTTTVMAETRTAYDMRCKVRYVGSEEEVDEAVRANLTRIAAHFQRLNSPLYSDGLKNSLWYSNDSTGARVTDFPLFEIGGDRIAVVDTLYYLQDAELWLKREFDTPDPPTFTLVVATNARINMTITAPAINGSAITGYQAQHRELGDEDWITHTSMGSSLNRSFQPLLSMTTFEFRVRATSAEGPGTWSIIQEATTT